MVSHLSLFHQNICADRNADDIGSQMSVWATAENNASGRDMMRAIAVVCQPGRRKVVHFAEMQAEMTDMHPGPGSLHVSQPSHDV
jgi:hypothetical protein